MKIKRKESCFTQKEEISIVQKFASARGLNHVQVRRLFIHFYGTLLIYGGLNMKTIKKYIYPRKSQSILNTLAKNHSEIPYLRLR